MPRRDHQVVFATDCEGPAVKNDNAREIAESVVPNGNRLFQQLSNFNVITVHARRRPTYNAGDTLRLLAPFLKAYKVTEADFANRLRTIRPRWMKGAKANVSTLKEAGFQLFQLTVSYRPFADVVARRLGIPRSHIYCTSYGLDRYVMSSPEARRLKEIAHTLIELPDVPTFEFDKTLRSSPVLREFNKLIWHELAETLPCTSRMLRELRAMGGQQKANALLDVVVRTDANLRKLTYVGDSITDLEVLQETERIGGLAICFNGDRFAVDTARYCCWGQDARVTGLLALINVRRSSRTFDRFVQSRGDRQYVANDPLLCQIYDTLSCKEWGIADRESVSLSERIEQSLKYRRLTRGLPEDL